MSLEQSTWFQLQGSDPVQPSEVGGLRLSLRACIAEASLVLDWEWTMTKAERRERKRREKKL